MTADTETSMPDIISTATSLLEQAICALETRRAEVAAELRDIDQMLAKVERGVKRPMSEVDGITLTYSGEMNMTATVQRVLRANPRRSMSARDILLCLPEEARAQTGRNAAFILNRLARTLGSGVSRAERGRYIWNPEESKAAATQPSSTPSPRTPAPVSDSPSATTSAVTSASQEVNS